MERDNSRTSPLCSTASFSFITDSSLLSSMDTSPQSFAPSIRNRRHTAASLIEAMEGAEDVSTVMTEVLKRMDRIVEHFRNQGQNDAANIIARNTVASVRVFNETIATWGVATATMQHTSHNSVDSPALQGNTMSSQSDAAATPAENLAPTSFPITWAAVAAVAPAQGNRLIRYTPDDSVQTTVGEVQGSQLLADADSNKRVIWIRGWSGEKVIGEVTSRVGQGPIYSMAYSDRDSAVCVIFQSALSAKTLYMDDCQHVRRHGHSRFGPGCDVIEGLAFPENDDIRRMSPPHNERRRLTFARSQLFTNGMTESKFKNDLYSIVGKTNVELVWLFNTGNATVVLAAVPLARLVRGHFIKTARNPASPYHGVTITFSHDPCERPMTLITQMPTGRAPRPATTYGYSGDSPAAGMVRGGPLSRRNTVGEVDGWHTVSRRR